MYRDNLLWKLLNEIGTTMCYMSNNIQAIKLEIINPLLMMDTIITKYSLEFI